jgi:hypothetical protein
MPRSARGLADPPSSGVAIFRQIDEKPTTNNSQGLLDFKRSPTARALCSTCRHSWCRIQVTAEARSVEPQWKLRPAFPLKGLANIDRALNSLSIF